MWALVMVGGSWGKENGNLEMERGGGKGRGGQALQLPAREQNARPPSWRRARGEQMLLLHLHLQQHCSSAAGTASSLPCMEGITLFPKPKHAFCLKLCRTLPKSNRANERWNCYFACLDFCKFCIFNGTVGTKMRSYLHSILRDFEADKYLQLVGHVAEFEFDRLGAAFSHTTRQRRRRANSTNGMVGIKLATVVSNFVSLPIRLDIP